MPANKKSKSHKKKGCWRRSGYRRRGAGNRGGRGRAGWGKRRSHKVQQYLKKGERPGSKGFTSIKPELETINVGNLLKLTDDKKINAKEYGYDKVLGRGEVNRPVELRVKKITKAAKTKIEEAGGTVKTE